ncbi:DUF4232 domain-containing protein [Micromonospora sp. NPDC049559]|uniref:DUF4232 domain-containing protein n=1 Tax=Micromonospora sp. NPDC049559 TaxID=3155923 RepID=UPI0034403111
MATRDDLTSGDGWADEFLGRRFDEYREDTMNRLRPAGALAARRAYERRRRSRLIAIAATTAAVAVLAAVGGNALVRRSAPPLPPAVSPSPAMPSPTASPSSTSPAPSRTGPSGATGSASGSPGSGQPATPRCRTGDLSVRLLGADGAMGSTGRYYALTNDSSRDCTITGIPTVRAVDGGGATLATAEPVGGGADRKLLLRPGAEVYLMVVHGFAGLDENADKSPCDPPADAIWLVLPGQTTHLTLERRTKICNGRFEVSLSQNRPGGFGD